MKKNICIRVLLVVLFLFLGTRLPFFFVVAAFIAYSIFHDLSGEPKKLADSRQRNNNWTFINAETPDWKSIYLGRVCESPAEVEFLTAMISSYQLTPDKGTLRGGGLELQPQVPIGHYRVDFLANKYLVVEIDGAAYHSSPEAVEKDRIRDEFFAHNGYVVLRIPAKIVFNSPNEAVERVRCALSNLAHERNIRSQKEARAKALNPPPTFFGELGKAIGDLNEGMNRASVLQKTARVFNETFDVERYAIRPAIELAKLRISTESWESKNPELKELYSEAFGTIDRAIGDTDKSPQTLNIPPLRPPDLGSDPKYSTAIEEMYAGLLEKRRQHFNDIRKTLEEDPELAKRVKEALEELFTNHSDLWQLIRPLESSERDAIVRATPSIQRPKEMESWLDFVRAKYPIK